MALTSPSDLERSAWTKGEALIFAAALELARSRSRHHLQCRPLDDYASSACYLALRYDLPTQEVIGTLFLDVDGRLPGGCALSSESELLPASLQHLVIESVLDPETRFRPDLVQLGAQRFNPSLKSRSDQDSDGACLLDTKGRRNPPPIGLVQ